jgi:hypothetical protein
VKLIARNVELLPPRIASATSAEPPLHCTWCFARVTADNLHPVLIAMDGVFEPRDLLGKTISLPIEGRWVDVFVATFLESHGYAGSQIVNFTCSARCQRELREQYESAAREDARTQRQATVQRRRQRLDDESGAVVAPHGLGRMDPRTRAKYERQLRNRCAYCLAKVKADAPVIGTGVWLRGNPDLTDLVGHVLAVDIGGRPIAGYVPEPGSDAAARHGHVVFLMCSKRCAASLAADVREDRDLAIVH